MSNMIDAIINLLNHPVIELKETYVRKNRANSTGDALEEYVKDLFAGTFDCTDEAERLEKISMTFSYLGNDSNPPDAMLKNGDAIEVKKIETDNSVLALNSSYPKHKLYRDFPMISNACRNAEQWEEKDMIYVVGILKKNKLKHLCMVYGLDFCASVAVYESLKRKIQEGIKQIPNISLTETRELGKLNKVDPLGITYLRIRGMWGIENPFQVFRYIFVRDMEKDFNFMAVINREKYDSFSNKEKLEELSKVKEELTITDVKIKNLDNPAQLRDAKLISIRI